MEWKENAGENKEPILEFEEFRKEMNNFHLYFHPGDFGKFQRKKSDLYKKFAEHNPDLESQLRAEMKKLSDYIKYPDKIPENSPIVIPFFLDENGKKFMSKLSKSKIIIVDENDKIIGCRRRESFRKEKEYVYRVAALWITNSRGEILLALRHRDKTHDPLKWGPAVAGTLKERENYHKNILKEAEEELGLKNIEPKLGPKVRMKGKYNYFTQFFTLKIDKNNSEFKIQQDEVEEIKWISKEELIRELNDNPENFTPGVRMGGKLFLGG